jgi:hypothetical protein
LPTSRIAADESPLRVDSSPFGTIRARPSQRGTNERSEEAERRVYG